MRATVLQVLTPRLGTAVVTLELCNQWVPRNWPKKRNSLDDCPNRWHVELPQLTTRAKTRHELISAAYFNQLICARDLHTLVCISYEEQYSIVSHQIG